MQEVTAQLVLYRLGNDSQSVMISRAIQILRQFPSLKENDKHEVHAMGTNIVGPLPDILSAIQAIYAELGQEKIFLQLSIYNNPLCKNRSTLRDCTQKVHSYLLEPPPHQQQP